MSKISANSRKNANADRNAIAPDHIFASMLDVASPLQGMGTGLDLKAGLRWDMEEISSEDLLKCFEQAGQQLGHDAGLERLRGHLMNLPRQAAKGLARQIAKGAAAGVLVALALGLVPSGAMAAVDWENPPVTVETREELTKTADLTDKENSDVTVKAPSSGGGLIIGENGLIKSNNFTISEGGYTTFRARSEDDKLGIKSNNIKITGTGSWLNLIHNRTTESENFTVDESGKVTVQGNNSQITTNNFTIDKGQLVFSSTDNILNLNANNITFTNDSTINIGGHTLNINKNSDSQQLLVNHNGGTVQLSKDGKFNLGKGFTYNLTNDGKIDNTAGEINLANGATFKALGTATTSSTFTGKNGKFNVNNGATLELSNTMLGQLQMANKITLGEDSPTDTEFAQLVLNPDSQGDKIILDLDSLATKQYAQIDASNKHLWMRNEDSLSLENGELNAQHLEIETSNDNPEIIFTFDKGIYNISGEKSSLKIYYSKPTDIDGTTETPGTLQIDGGSKLVLSSSEGTIDGNLNIANGTLDVVKGTWTDEEPEENNITLTIGNNGKLNLGTAYVEATNPGSLANLTVHKLDNNGTVKIVNGKLTTTNLLNSASSTFDISGHAQAPATLAIVGGKDDDISNKGKIGVRANGVLEVTSAGLGKLLTDGGKVVLNDDAAEYKNGDAVLLLTDKDISELDASKINNYTTTGSATDLTMYHNGVIKTTSNNLTLTGNSLNMGIGATNNSRIEVRNLGLAPTSGNEFSMTAGNIILTGAENSPASLGFDSDVASKTFKLGDGSGSPTTNPATLTLNGATTGNNAINGNVTLVGDNAKMDVNSGIWDMADGTSLAVNKGNLNVAAPRATVGTPQTAATLNTKTTTISGGTVTVNKDGTLTADKLEVKDATTANLTNYGSISTKELDVSAGKVDVTGKLSATGDATFSGTGNTTITGGIFEAANATITGGTLHANKAAGTDVPAINIDGKLDLKDSGTLKVDGGASANLGSLAVGNTSGSSGTPSLTVGSAATPDPSPKPATTGKVNVAGDATFTGGTTTINDGSTLAIDGKTTTTGSTPLITVAEGGEIHVTHTSAGVVDEEKSKEQQKVVIADNTGTISKGTVNGAGRIELLPPDFNKDGEPASADAGYHSAVDLRSRFGTDAVIDVNGWYLWELDPTKTEMEYYKDLETIKAIEHIANDQIHNMLLTKVDGQEQQHDNAYHSIEWKGIVLGKEGESKNDGTPDGKFSADSDKKLVVDQNLTLVGSSDPAEKDFIVVRREKQEKYQNNEKAPIQATKGNSLTLGLKDDKANYGLAGDITLNKSEVVDGKNIAGGKLVVQGKTNDYGNPVSEFTVDKIVAQTGSGINVDGAILNVEANVAPGTVEGTDQTGSEITVTNGKLDVKNSANATNAILADKATVTNSRLTANGNFRVNTLTVRRSGVVQEPEQPDPAMARAADLPDPVTSDVYVKGNLAADTIKLEKGQGATAPTVYVDGGNITPNSTIAGTDIIGNGNVIATTKYVEQADKTLAPQQETGNITANNINGGEYTPDGGNKTTLAFSGNIIAGGDIIANQIIAANATIEAKGTTPATAASGTPDPDADPAPTAYTGNITVAGIKADGGTVNLNARKDLTIRGTNADDGILQNANGGNVNINADKVAVSNKVEMNNGDLNIVANAVNLANLTMANGKLKIEERNPADGSQLVTAVSGATNLTNVYGTVDGSFTTGNTATGSGTVNIKNSDLQFGEFDPYGNVTVDKSRVAVSSLGTYYATEGTPGQGNYLRSNLAVNSGSTFGVGYTRESLAQMENTIRKDLADNKLHEPSAIFVAANQVNVGGGSIHVAPDANQTITGNNIVVGPHAVVAVDNKNVGNGGVAFTGVTGVNADKSSVIYITNPIKNGTITMATSATADADGKHNAVAWSPDKDIKIVTDSALLFKAKWQDNGSTINTRYQGAKEAMPKISSDIAGIVDRLYLTPGYENNHAAGAEYIKRTVDHFDESQHKAAAATIETPARLAAIAGAPQMTGAAHHAAINIANQRTSFAAPNARMTSYNGTTGEIQTGASGGNDYKSGVGVWVQPMYQSTNTHGMKAGNLKMDTNGALAGVAAGADVTIADTVRLGVTVNGGKGYATGSGDFNKAKNDFSFVGVGAYAGVRAEQVGVTADVNYTSAFNKMKADVPNGIGGNLKSDVNSSAVSVGLRGEYDIPVNDNVSIVPHVGVRYTNLKVDSYKVKQGGQTVLKADESNQSYWTFPVGVAVAGKVDTGNGWYVRPSADVGVIPAAGDIKHKNSVRFTGIDKSADVASRVMDNWTFSGQTGVEFGNDTVSFGVTYNLQATGLYHLNFAWHPLLFTE